MDRYRSWCFTLHYEDEECDDYKRMMNIIGHGENVVDDDQIPFRYMIFGKETCPKTGRRHLQGYVMYDNGKTMRTVKQYISNRAHLERAGGNAKQNIDYCSKEGVYYERGRRPKVGERRDLRQAVNYVEEGATLREIVPYFGNNMQAIRVAERHFTLFEQGRNWKPEVTWIYGPAGYGKTRMAYDIMDDDVYVCTDTCQWWDGYDAHEDVLIDDMRGDFAKFHVLLRILDRYACRVPYKGGFRQLLARRIVITSCYDPCEMYENRTDEDIGQLLRRIDTIVHLNSMDDAPVLYETYYDEGERKFMTREI